MLSTLVALIALSLTVVMFITRERLLAWPAVIFWAIFGGWSYSLSTHAWTDIYYYLFFAGFAMAIFCMLAQYGLREVDNRKTDKDEYIDEGANPDDQTYLDEDQSPTGEDITDDDGIIKDEYIGKSKASMDNRREKELRRRAATRGSRGR